MFTILDLEKEFTKQKINKAKKLKVREFEEEKKNHFVCFVDEDDQSYDVQIAVSAQSEITGHSCDCGSENFCMHRLALSLMILKNKGAEAKSKRTVKKKVSDAEIAMENLNSEEMKHWLLEFFKKNKDAEVQFLLEFGEKKENFSDEEIRGMIKKTIQSVIGKKKKITAPEVKKIIDLITKSLEPVEHYLYQNSNKEAGFEKYSVISDEITNFQMSVYTASTRIDKFLDDFKKRFVSNFNSVKDFELWKKIAAKYWTIFLKGEDSLPYYLYNFIIEMYHSGNEKQKFFIAELVKNQIEIWIENDVDLRVSMKEDLLKIVSENNFFVPLQSFFPLYRYENSYNIKLINEIMKFDRSKAEKACKSVIDGNSNDKYNFPYYEILEKIYQDDKNNHGLAYIKRKKFIYNYNLEDFLFISKHDDQVEFNKFRTRILSALRGSFLSDHRNIEFYFEILELEGNYRKMIEVLNESIPTYIISKYAEKLFMYDKNKFLNTFRKRIVWAISREEDEIIADFLISRYDPDLLKDVFSKNTFGIRSGNFSQLVLDRMKR
nr:hypothetical protein [uncultured Chryseobacterium sp.]